MATNCKIELNGYLGQEPKTITKEGKTFIALRVATTDSYPVKDEKSDETKWKDRETIWHDVLVFRPTAAHFARELKKGDAVQISGSIGYRPFKDENGHTRNQASIVALYIEKQDFARQDQLFVSDIEQAIEASSI